MAHDDELLQTLPPVAQAFIAIGQPKLKDQPPDPADFYGRELELDGLMNAITSVTSGQTATSRASTEVRAAAPGAGKTTLIDGLDRQLRTAGIGHIQLQPIELTNAQAFSDAVKRQPPYSYFAQGQMVLEKTTNTITVAADAAFHLPSHVITKVTTAGIADAPNTEIAQRVIEQWHAGATPMPRDVVQAVNTMWRNGTVITIDETQDLADVAAAGEARTCAETIIGTLASHQPRQLARIDRAILCCFGLADSPKAVRELGSPTVNAQALAPLHRGYVRMMISGAIRKGADGSDQLREWAECRWVESLTEEFGDWTRHAQAATQAAQDTLTEFGDELRNAEWADRAVRALAIKYRRSAYQGIRYQVENQKLETWIPELTVRALWCNGNEIRQGMLDKAMRNGILQRRPNLPDKEAEEKLERATRRLMRCGVMDSTDLLPNQRDGNRKAYYAPIPSLLRNLNEDPIDDPTFIRRLLGAAGLNDDPEHRPQQMFHPNWPDWSPELAAARRAKNRDSPRHNEDD